MEYLGIAIIPLITGVVEVIKEASNINKKFLPIISLLLGILAGVILFSNGNIAEGVVKGISMGLAAVGLHSGTTNIYQGIKKELK